MALCWLRVWAWWSEVTLASPAMWPVCGPAKGLTALPRWDAIAALRPYKQPRVTSDRRGWSSLAVVASAWGELHLHDSCQPLPTTVGLPGALKAGTARGVSPDREFRVACRFRYGAGVADLLDQRFPGGDGQGWNGHEPHDLGNRPQAWLVFHELLAHPLGDFAIALLARPRGPTRRRRVSQRSARARRRGSTRPES